MATATLARQQRLATGAAVADNGRPKGSAHKATPEVCEQVKRMAAEKAPKAVIARVCKLSRQTVYTILGS